ncbi:hypothetical protein CARUB_v10021663mg, partial [Capsella rubella]
MQQAETLPHELEEEIVSHLPTKILARFSSVCKRWYTLFKERRFFNNDLGLARPQFIFFTVGSKIISVDVNLEGPSIEVYNLPSHIHSLSGLSIEYCDGLFTYLTNKGIGVCNPWLKQIRWIRSNGLFHHFNGMGYDNSRPGKHYKILGSINHRVPVTNTMFLEATVTEIGSNKWKSYEFASKIRDITSPYSVSMNGNLYWIAINRSREQYIETFDFSMERFKPYCVLGKIFFLQTIHILLYKVGFSKLLAVFREDRFSFLEQEYFRKNIKIWVTKEKIKNGDGEAVEWVNVMSVLVPEWSSLVVTYPLSYFINEDKSLMSLVICCNNKEGKPYIYIAKGDKFHEFEIKDLVGEMYGPCTYFPSLVQVPTFTMSGRSVNQQQEVDSRFALPRGIQVSVGVRGDEWDDGSFDNVNKIIVDFNDLGVIFIKFYYCNGYVVVAGDAHGDSTTETRTIIVAKDDYIEAVEGTYTESHITSITFRLHKAGKYKSLQLGLLD